MGESSRLKIGKCTYIFPSTLRYAEEQPNQPASLISLVIMAIVAALSREKLLTNARSLPAAPQVLSELGELLQDVNTGLDEISDLLKRDAALAARIIRISNSSAMGGGSRIGSVEEAVNRVGFAEVYRLVGLATTSRLADRDLNYYRLNAEPLRHHMMFGALAAEALAQRCGMDARNAYTAGLMRPLGMLLIDRAARERVPITEAFDPEKNESYDKWEGAIFGICHTEVAAMILGEWKFPVEMISMVREHYLSREADFSNTFACILNLAVSMTTQAGLGFVGEPHFTSSNERALQAIGLDGDALAEISAQITEAYERIKESI